MLNIVSEEQISQYERDGVICLRGLFDDSWVLRLQNAVDSTISAHRPEVGSLNSPRDLRRYGAVFDEFNRRSPAARIAKTLMRSKQVHFYFDQIFYKEPNQRSAPTLWHHDLPFWPIQGDQVCSIWLALDYVTKESSGMEYVAGSHRWGKFFKPPIKGADDLGFDSDNEMPDIESDRTNYPILSWDMNPGDCLVHHGLAIHMAGTNLSQSVRRRAIATRWFGDDATYRCGGGDQPLQVPGLETGDAMPEDRFFVVETASD